MFKSLSAEQIGPQFVSPVVLFLASDLAADVTGQIVGVHGPKIFLYRIEQTEGVEKDPKKGLWSPQEIREAWGRITGS
jgi:hypothetical protein